MEKLGKRCSEMQVGGKRKNKQKQLSNISNICFTCKEELLQHPVSDFFRDQRPGINKCNNMQLKRSYKTNKY